MKIRELEKSWIRNLIFGKTRGRKIFLIRSISFSVIVLTVQKKPRFEKNAFNACSFVTLPTFHTSVRLAKIILSQINDLAVESLIF